MKVLLCSISDQHIPNLLSVHHFNPDEVVLLESEAMKKSGAAERFLRALEYGGKNFSKGGIQGFDNANSLSDVKSALQKSYRKFPDASWIVNLTGGTKPMSIAIFDFFRSKDALLCYIGASKRNEILFFNEGKEQEVCSYKPSGPTI